MMDKRYAYKGQLFIMLAHNRLTFHQKIAKRNIALLYGLPDETANEVLELVVRKSPEAASSVSLVLEKINRTKQKEQILELEIENSAFLVDILGGRHSECKRTVDMWGGYRVRSVHRLVEAIFTHDDGTVFTVVTNPDASVSGTFDWMYGLWVRSGKWVDCCLYRGGSVVPQSQAFSDIAGEATFNVAQSCYLIPITEDDGPIKVPWNSDLRKMIEMLSNILNIDPSSTRLFDLSRQPLSQERPFVKGDFSSPSQKGALAMFYGVEGSSTKCRSMVDNSILLEVMLIQERTVAEVKRRLAIRLKKEADRIILCKGGSFLEAAIVISTEEELKYFVGLSPDLVEIIKSIGSGRFGNVQKCLEKTTSEVFALKKYRQPLSNETNCQIITEFLVMVTVPAHENIVRYRDVYVHGDEISLGMEYVGKGSLARHMVRNQHLSVQEVRSFSTDILHGINHLHACKVSSRDVNPNNILLGKGNVAKLCDFGLSKILFDLSRTDVFKNWTQTKDLGTFRYMAPEIMNGERYSFKVDLWSLGATAVHMVTGKRPYHKLEEDPAILRIANQRTIPYEVPQTFPTTVRSFIDSCLNQDSSARPTGVELLGHPFIVELQ